MGYRSALLKHSTLETMYVESVQLCISYKFKLILLQVCTLSHPYKYTVRAA